MGPMSRGGGVGSGWLVAVAQLLWLCQGRTDNCFALVEEWSLIISHNASQAAISLHLTEADTGLRNCLHNQPETIYRILVSGDEATRRYLHPSPHSWTGSAVRLLAAPLSFPYLIYGGRYRLGFTSCDSATAVLLADGCEGASVYSDYVTLKPAVLAHCDPEGGSAGNASLLEMDAPAVLGLSVVFRFAFIPCSPVLPYDEANVTLHSAARRDECGSGTDPVLQETLPLQKSTNGSFAVILYQTPELQGERFYCLSASVSHISCQLAGVERPNHCWLRSDPVWVASIPPIGRIIPLCQSHLACAWLYIAVTGTLLLLLSLVLALLCLRACDHRCKAKSRAAEEVDFFGEVVELSAVSERLSWSQLHAQWEARQDKARARILLLYSPDTKLFKELQAALKSFLQQACHSEVYDLFDDALFDSIALDPSEWLEKFVSDRDVKIIVISSIGAYRRQMALQGQMPLNLPENAVLDGLFTSGLRFVSTYPGLAASGRVATARYEMLHLTEEGHRLLPPVGGNREFLIPTQLHEIFCWVHQLQPLDLMGKPWDHYHLELQLLQDSLKLARRDRTIVGNTSGIALI